MKKAEQVVYVVDDDASMREAIKTLIETVGLSCRTFEIRHEFLESRLPDVPGCLVLDVRLPGLSGLNLQRELNEKGVQIPIIFITGHGDIPMSVQAMKAGAVEFLTKPFRDQDLLDAVERATSTTARLATSGPS
jgi:FixJ family two-component response regulator